MEQKYDENQPHTYGEESEYYERQDRERAEKQSQPNYGNPYGYGGQAYGGQGGYTGQPYGTDPGSQGGYGTQQNGAGYGQPYGGAGGYTNQPYGPGNGNPYAGQGNPYGNQGNPYGNQGNPYGNQGNPYAGQYHPYNGQGSPYNYGRDQSWHGPVKDLYCYIVLVVMVARMFVLMGTYGMIFGAIDDYNSLMSGAYMYKLQGNTLYTALANISSLLFVTYIVFVVLDIVAVNRANYKITGLILFAIFLTPGYYIWRAHVLGRKKTFPVIYTIFLSLLVVISIVMLFSQSFSLAMGMMEGMY